MIKKNIIVPVACLLFVALVIFSVLKISALNKKFPNPIVIEHAMNEAIKGGETSLAVQSYDLLNGSQLRKLLPDYEEVIKNSDGSSLKDDQVRYLLVHIKLINNSDEIQKMMIANIVAESLIWANGIDAEIYMDLNIGKGSPMSIELQPKQELEVIVPYSMYSFQFQAKDWKNVDNRAFDLSLSTYPKKHIITLTR